MSKFKVGDKVRIGIAVNGAPDGLNGSTGVIEFVNLDDKDYKVRMDADKDYWWYVDEEMHLVEASPVEPDTEDPTTLTRRDHFAMSAMIGLIANQHSNKDADVLARSAYQAADAMELARNKGAGSERDA